MRRLFEREARESVMYQHTGERLHSFLRDSRRRDQAIHLIVASMVCVQSFKEVKAERELACPDSTRSLAPPLTTAFWTSRPEIFIAGHIRMRLTVFHWCQQQRVAHLTYWFFRTVEVTILIAHDSTHVTCTTADVTQCCSEVDED